MIVEVKANQDGTFGRNVVVGRTFIAAFFSKKSKTIECSRCGRKFSVKLRINITNEVWNHWRNAHKTEFTKYALMGVSQLLVFWWEPTHLPNELKRRVPPYYVQLIGAQL